MKLTLPPQGGGYPPLRRRALPLSWLGTGGAVDPERSTLEIGARRRLVRQDLETVAGLLGGIDPRVDVCAGDAR